MPETLDALVRRVDQDRWLASRFARDVTRERLAAFYALNYEIARTAEVVTQDGLGRIRLAWWREGVAEIYAGGPVRAHPALQGYAQAAREDELPREPLDALIDAHEKDFELTPFADWKAADAYLDATAGNVLRLAVAICGGEAEAFVKQAALAWGYTGLLRAQAFWAARARNVLPAGVSAADVRARVRETYLQARAAAQELPPAAFPAIGYVAFTRMYLRAFERGRDLPLLARQLRIAFASATGGL